MGAINPLKKVYGAFSSSPTTRKLMGKPGQMLNDREFSRRKPLPLGMGIGATYKKEI